jgi:tRNA(adenine34) deaminase
MRTEDTELMELALVEADAAGNAGEVPVGAILVSRTGEILARAGNRTITDNDPSGHAEMVTLREASKKTGNYRLLGATLYATIEPCVMCMGAIMHARIERLVFGAPDPKWGAAGSLYDFSMDKRFNHRLEVTGGVLEDRCRELMQAFFRERR